MASLVEAAPGEEKPKRKVKYASGFFAGVGNNKPVPKEKAAADAHPDTVCGVCGAADSYSRCGRCQKVVYCGPECQEYDWWRHKKTCIPWDYKPIPAAEQSTICPYCQREVKMKDLGLHMDSDCGKYLDVMLGRKPMPPMDGPDPADDDGNDEPEVEWVPSPKDPSVNLVKGGPPPRERKGKDGGPVAPPKRDRRRERFKKDLNPVYPGLEGKTQKPLSERERPADAAAGRLNPFWDFVDEYPTTARGAMLMGWCRHRHRAMKDEDLIDRPNRGENATAERAEAAKRHHRRIEANEKMVQKLRHAIQERNVFKLGEVCDETNYWFTPREAKFWHEDIAMAHGKLKEYESNMKLCVTDSMWKAYSDLRKVQQRIVNAYREEDREITGKLRPGMEKMLKDVQELFESTQVGAVGRMAG
ncbi:hypothetical protein SO694_00003734 [Aureococcus anophagefferens]|uniref:MYND-type domain-containing protein n=1 Tax=Aureococcus anophagefferens TaxID=44056 RepID=A0ABR1GDP4_AURAN|nr:hypothetical protein JL722_1592 [Aureococcus anophagefferens]